MIFNALPIKLQIWRLITIIIVFLILGLSLFKVGMHSRILAKDNFSGRENNVTIVYKYREDRVSTTESLDKQVEAVDLDNSEVVENKYDLQKDTAAQIEENLKKYPQRAQRVAQDAVVPDLSLVKEVQVGQSRAEKVLERLQNNSQIEYAFIQKDPQLLPEIPLSLPDDPIYSNSRAVLEGISLNPGTSYHLQNMGLNPTDDGNSDSGWDANTGSDTVTVAVYGWSGFDYTHPEIEENTWLNPGEFPDETFPGLDDNSDGVITASELKSWSVQPLADWNSDGRINLKDVFIASDDNLFLDGIDNDNNGYTDDFIGWDFQTDSNNLWDDGTAVGGHDTMAAGIIGALGNNSFGMTGINWKVRLMMLDGDYSQAVIYATNNGADVVNISYSGQGIGDKTAIDYAWANGTAVVFSAGNGNDEIIYSNTRSERTWLVGGVLVNNTKASWSDWGNRLDFAAPGYAIYSTTSDYDQSPSSIPMSPYPKVSYQIDGNGNPALVYYDYERDKLVFGVYSLGAWAWETVSEGKYMGLYPSLVFDSANRPHVSAYDWDDRELIYFTQIDGSWQETALTDSDDQGYFTQIKINGSDMPVIAFINRTGNMLELATYNGSWTIEDVVSIGSFDLSKSRVGLGFGPLGDTQLAFYQKSTGDLGYATKTDGIWTATYPDSTGNVGAYLDIVFDDNHLPRIVYTNLDSWDTKLAVYDGAEWTTQTVLASGNVGYYDNQIAIKTDGSTVITTAASTSRLYYIWHDGSTWQNEEFGSSEYLGAVHELGLVADNPLVYSFSWHRGFYQANRTDSWAYTWLLDYGVNYKYGSGTSFAAPQIAGAAALLISAKPTWRLDQIYWLLASTATHFGSPGWHETGRGWGVPNLHAALAVSEPLADDTPPTASFSSPVDGETIEKGTVAITGTANDANFTYYNLFYKRHSSSNWQFISGYSRTGVDSDTIANWSTGDTDGDYDLKLEVSDWYQTTTTQMTVTVGSGEPTPTPTPNPAGVFALSSITATPSTTSAVISWDSEVLSSSQVDYGLTDSYGTTTDLTDTSPMVASSHQVTLSPLLACTTYHYQVKSVDIESNEVLGDDSTFTTTGCTGNSEIIAHFESLVTSASGDIINLDHNGSGITLFIPGSFADSDAVFEIKQLNKTSFINSTGNPATGYLPGGLVYFIQALTASGAITSFNQPITITINYAPSDITGLKEGDLVIYRWNGSVWSALTDCSVDTTDKTVSCSTTAFSSFMIFGPESSTNSESSNTNSTPSTSTPTAPTCADTAPSSSPDLFQIVTTQDQATLYFAPAGNPVDKYYIAYGTDANQLEYGAEYNQGYSSGVLSYTVSSLVPKTTYYFQVRGGHGCMPGDWSKVLIAQTTSGTQTGTYYPDSITTNASSLALVKVRKNASPSSILSPTDAPTPTPESSHTNQEPTSESTPKTQHCFLWWCW